MYTSGKKKQKKHDNQWKEYTKHLNIDKKLMELTGSFAVSCFTIWCKVLEGYLIAAYSP